MQRRGGAPGPAPFTVSKILLPTAPPGAAAVRQDTASPSVEAKNIAWLTAERTCSSE